MKKIQDTLAIDLAPDAVRVLDVSFRRGAPMVSTVVCGSLEAGGPETLPDRHLAALGALLSAHRLRRKHCIASMPTSLVVTRSMTIDPGKPQRPEDQIRTTLQNCVPGDARDMVFDYWPVSEAAPTNRAHDVLVVASQGAMVRKYLDGFANLRLTCTHLDVAPCALASLISKLMPAQDGPTGTIALTDTLGYFAVVDKQRVLFWRPFELSRGTTQNNLPRIGDEISKCVSHMVGALHLDGMTELVAFGPGAHDQAFTAYMLNRFNLQVKTPSPFESLPGDALPADLRSALAPAEATSYAAALGLALQTAGGAVHG
jgi:Tfp pilus assembly PilM family ATPase